MSDGYHARIEQEPSGSGRYRATVTDPDGTVQFWPDGAVAGFFDNPATAQIETETFVRTLARIPNLPFHWQEDELPIKK